MIVYKKKLKKKIISIPDRILCDKCGKEFQYDTEDIAEKCEVHEFARLRFHAGYGSVFGDGNLIECDLCQHCLYDMIKGYYRIVESDLPFWENL